MTGLQRMFLELLDRQMPNWIEYAIRVSKFVVTHFYKLAFFLILLHLSAPLTI